ncbi:MAG: hypothetical protein ABI647_13410 [Gemmatimonadota bacterium]
MRLSLSLVALTLMAPTIAVAEIDAGAVFGPPWISIELPGNPWGRNADAYLLVHAFHHGTPAGFPVTGTAEGIVGGERKSIPLTFQRTEQDGVYALKNQWGTAGEWTLVITVSQGADDVAQAVVQLNAAGKVFSVDVPTRESQGRQFPRRITAQEIDGTLRNRPVVAAGPTRN